MKKRVAFLISGGGSNMVSLVESLQDSGQAEPVLVFSNNPDAAGLDRAREMGVPMASVDHRMFGQDRAAFESEMEQYLIAAKPDIICNAGFMRILTPEFVARWPRRMLNIHPSLLPRYPGLNTHQRALDAGDQEAGCTVHWVTAELDAGPVIGQARVPIMPDDDAETLAARVLKKEHILYPMALHRVLAGDNRSFML